jgi:hypothetical protein
MNNYLNLKILKKIKNLNLIIKLDIKWTQLSLIWNQILSKQNSL